MVKGSMFDTFYYQGSPIKDWPGDLASEEAEADLDAGPRFWPGYRAEWSYEVIIL